MRRIGIVLMVCAAALAGCGFAGCAQSAKQQTCNNLRAADAIIAPLELSPTIGDKVADFRAEAKPIIDAICAWSQNPDGPAPGGLADLWDILQLAEAYANVLPEGDSEREKIATGVAIAKAALFALGFQPPPPPEPEPPSAWLRTRWQLEGWAVPT